MVNLDGIKYILLSTFYFSLMNVCVKMLPHLPSNEIVLFRAFVSLAIGYVLLKINHIPIWGNNKKYLILRGIFGTFALLLYFYSLQRMPLATAVTIQYLSPIFSTILAIFILKEYTSFKQWIFFIISFSGVLLIRGFEVRISTFVLITGVLSALMSGFAYNYIRKLKDYDHPLVIVFYFPLLTVPIVLPYTVFTWVTPHGWDWIFLIMIGIITQQAQYYMTKAYQSDKIAVISNFNYIGIIYAIIFGYLLFGETIHFVTIFGTLMIIFGVILSSRYK